MFRTTTLSVVFALIVAALASQAQTVTFSQFTNPHPTPFTTEGTVGFTFATNKFVGTVLKNGTGSLYSTDLTGGNVQLFAPTVSLNSSSGEHYVAASFGQGGFAQGDVWAADGTSIVHISNSGATSSTFVTGFSGEVRGITFDLFGTYNNNMLVTTKSGDIYKVNSAGTKTLLASVGEDVEGLDIAPVGGNFNGLSGQLIVGSEVSGAIRAISPGGVVTTLGDSSGQLIIASAEELTFVPLNVGASGSPLEGLYGADYTNNVLFAGANQFNSNLPANNMAGDLIVTGETNKQVSRVHWNGSQFVVTNIGAFNSQPEDGIFVTPNMVPEPSTLSLLGLGGLAALRRQRR